MQTKELLQQALNRADNNHRQLAAEYAQLNEHLNVLVEAQNRTINIDQLDEQITCPNCRCTMWRPFILPGCGHSFCYACLDYWFSLTLTQYLTVHPHYTFGVPQEEQFQSAPPSAHQNMLGHQHNLAPPYSTEFSPPPPPYICMRCNAPVKTEPIDDFALQAIVKIVAEAKGEVEPPDLNTTPAYNVWYHYFR
ncbi:hypothetical protein HGRIS_012395 [Hohenbuehelia grisea]|uniref:RING-type domain-containing protein n=1 Tax=Hohenbuehelia grisea TaxID=104357 RepID=A0ABR3IS48_9AGAR